MKHSYHNFKVQYVSFVWVLLLIIFIISGLVVVEWTENKRFLENQRRSVVEQLSTIRAKLEGALNAEMLLAQSIVSIVVTNKDITKDRFFKVSDHFFNSSKHIRNIGLAKGTILTYVYPVEGNEKAIGIDYKKIASQWPAVQQAIEERKTIIAGPLELVQGGVAIIGRTPIYIDNVESGKEEYFGILSIVINIPSLFDAAGLDNKDTRLKVSIRGKDAEGAKGEIFHGSEDLFENDPVLMAVSLPEGEWIMAATPTDGWLTTSENILYYRIIALIVSVVILFLFFAQQRETKTRKLAEAEKEKVFAKLQNTLKELQHSKKEFESIFENSLVGIFLMSPDRTVLRCNRRAAEMAGYQREDFIGSRLKFLYFSDDHFNKLGATFGELFEGDLLQIEFPFKKKDGGTIWCLLSGRALDFNEPERGAIIVSDDITERKQLEENLTVLSMTDQLTGAYNRRAFEDMLNKEKARAKRYNKPLSLILFDIDFFKNVNDTFGHDAGDQILQDIANLSKEQIRQVDSLFRWGGEEFIILLPETEIKVALSVAERLRAKVEEKNFSISSNITISLGVSHIHSNDSAETLVKRADVALYKAKQNGRNRVVISE